MDQTEQVVPSAETDPLPPHSYHAHVHQYRVSNAVTSKKKRGALVDRGANGGILGDDAVVMREHTRQVDVTGIDNHEMNGLKLVDAAAKVSTQKGPAILIMNQYAYHGLGRTIHSSGQIEAYKNKVDDRSMKIGGNQCIRTLDGYLIPLDIINGLPYLKMVPPTDTEMKELPHIIFTPANAWDPKILDNVLSDKDDWYNTLRDLDEGIIDSPFDMFGNYRHRHKHEVAEELPPVDGRAEFETLFHGVTNLNERFVGYEHDVQTKPPDYKKYRPYFLHVPVEKIRKTFQNTTQFATNIMSGRRIEQTINSPYPAHNVWRRNEPMATDTIFAEVPAIDSGGQKMAQIFVGRKTLVIDVYGMSTEKEFVNTLEDEIRKRGAMDKLISDSARVEISNRVKDVLRALLIDSWQSEPNYQHQNFAEHRWKHLKGNVQWIMNSRNVDPAAWLLCTEWVADVMNHTAEKSLGWRPPLQVLTGQTVDISIMLVFLFWDIVYVPRYKEAGYKGQIGSTKSSEVRGRFVGFAWDVGHALTFKILTDDTKKIICRSRVRLAKEGENNIKLDLLSDDVSSRVFIKSKRDEDEDVVLPTIDISTDPFTVDETTESAPVVEEAAKGATAPKSHGHKRSRRRGAQQRIPRAAPVEVPEMLDDDIPELVQGQGASSSDDESDEEPTPTVNPPLRDLPEVETVEEDEDLPDHLRSNRKPGDPNPAQKPVDFLLDNLRTENPMVHEQLSPEDLPGRSFLMPPEEDGSRYRAKIIEQVQLSKDEAAKHPDLIKFKALVNDEFEEIVAYNDIVDYIEDDESWDGVWKYREILGHEGPLNRNDPRYKGSKYNLRLLWEGGEISWEPLTTVDKQGVYDTDRVTVAIYASKHALLDTPGWKLPGLKKIAKTQKRLLRVANQAKLHSFRTKPVYMYGFQVPRNHSQAMELDAANGNTKWRDAEIVELTQIDDYDTFDDRGKDHRPPPDYKKITVHLIYAVKHDGRHKARLVAGGHLTETPIDSVYSSVISLRGIRLMAFLAELNNLEFWSTDIGNAYLESYTQEKVYIRAGPEFGEQEGHILVIVKALYGLKSSGLRWHERLADVLRSMGFFPSRAERDIWMRDMGDHYEYIAVYVDDLAIVSRNAKAITDMLSGPHNFKLKGTGPVTFHLGCDFFRDPDGVLCYAPRKYIEKTIDNYVRIFGQKPKQYTSPLVKGDHPELDTSDLLEIDDIKIYQSLIGALQWTVQIGRFDVGTAVMTMSRFRAAPRQGHLDRVKRINGYLSKMRHAVIRIRTDVPDFSDIPEKHYEWEYTCYHGAKEALPTDAPEPKGKPVHLSSYVDANLCHDLISGRSVTGILHLANKTPIDWYSKLQATVETATFGSEFVAARTCTDQVVDLRTTFRYLGVPLGGQHMMFGDNETVVNASSLPHAKLHKRHNALSFHRCREAIAAGILRFHHIPGITNPADILSKHWDYSSVWSVLKPLLFHRGDTADLVPRTEPDDGARAHA